MSTFVERHGYATVSEGSTVAGESLRVISGNASGTEISLEGDFLIGRAAPGEGKLGDDPEISRSHARVFRGPDGRLMVEDLGSRNGTRGERGRGSARSAALAPGDTIKVGTTTLQLLDSEGNAFQATALAGSGDAGATRASVPPAAAPPPPPPAPARHAAARRAGHTGRGDVHPAEAAHRGARSPRRARPTPPPPAAPAAQLPARRSRATPPRNPRHEAAPAAGPCSAAWRSWPRPSSWACSCSAAATSPKTLATREIVDQNRAATVSINTRGPARDAER